MIYPPRYLRKEFHLEAAHRLPHVPQSDMIRHQRHSFVVRLQNYREADPHDWIICSSFVKQHLNQLMTPRHPLSQYSRSEAQPAILAKMVGIGVKPVVPLCGDGKKTCRSWQYRGEDDKVCRQSVSLKVAAYLDDIGYHRGMTRKTTAA